MHTHTHTHTHRHRHIYTLIHTHWNTVRHAQLGINGVSGSMHTHTPHTHILCTHTLTYTHTYCTHILCAHTVCVRACVFNVRALRPSGRTHILEEKVVSTVCGRLSIIPWRPSVSMPGSLCTGCGDQGSNGHRAAQAGESPSGPGIGRWAATAVAQLRADAPRIRPRRRRARTRRVGGAGAACA